MADGSWNRVVNFADVVPTESYGHDGMSVHPYVTKGRGTEWLHVTLNVIEAGGGIQPHYHADTDADHAYFFVRGEGIARIGDDELEIHEQGLMVFKASVVHGFRVTSPDGALVLRMAAAPGDMSINGERVFVDE